MAHDPGPHSTMDEVLRSYPGAQRALFRKYHIGGCSSCAFRADETLAEVCARNNNLLVEEVIEFIKSSHAQDEQVLISPKELQHLLEKEGQVKLLDIRSREEFEAVRVDGSVLMSQSTMQEMLGSWSRDDVIVVIDHLGRSGLDAAAYFAGHGFNKVRCLRGGIDAWAQEVDSTLRRYRMH